MLLNSLLLHKTMEDIPLKVKAIIQVLGAPENHVQETLKKVVGKVKEVKEIQVLKEELADTQQMEDKKLWSNFAELELQVKEMGALVNFCFDFMPSSIEILEPEKIGGTREPLTNLLNDLIARLHQYDMLLKNLHAENLMLKKKVED
tara:strand:- start:44889 stop:45329 length:441 start_codon:yes stop_codon:yes gene_type:complete